MYVSITYRIFKLRTYEFSFNINFKTLKIKITMIGVRFLFLCGFHTGLACYGLFFTWHASGYYHVAFILDSLATVVFSHDTPQVIITWLSYWTRLLRSFFTWHALGYYHVAFILDSLATVLFHMTRLRLLSRGFHTGLACYGPFFTWHASGYYHVAFILDSLATVLFGMTRLGLLSRGFHTGLASYGPFSHDTLRVIIAWLSYWTRLLGSFFAWHSSGYYPVAFILDSLATVLFRMTRLGLN